MFQLYCHLLLLSDTIKKIYRPSYKTWLYPFCNNQTNTLTKQCGTINTHKNVETCLPYGQRVDGYPRILKSSSHYNQDLIIPVLQTVQKKPNTNCLKKSCVVLVHTDNNIRKGYFTKVKCWYQSITPEEAESLRNSQSPVKASKDKPVQVSGQPPQTE